MTHIIRPDREMTFCNRDVDKNSEVLDEVLETKPDVCSYCALKVIELLLMERAEFPRMKTRANV